MDKKKFQYKLGFQKKCIYAFGDCKRLYTFISVNQIHMHFMFMGNKFILITNISQGKIITKYEFVD